ncbi:selenocysteine-specific translation elongation factor [Abyssisolibacter fermentans]|uniref:selenocysteine-specific translation elongation factor n=1 Tax=Abyssisolibacter fermentans TaxID=1766203 RepID=UPI0008379776|nr:selenocysteine-specific translation elongation factor [Abyssisolibacter fermentans]
MKNIIIGTAGHIDHGKTTLIRAITGRETDRLVEEKERGITIELGFTYFDLPSGRRAGIIDVPGHEKFIKNMLAGVIGMDIVVLVIAADEGVMPQTKEHLDILNMLGIKKGVVALNKADMVDEEWMELVIEDVRDSLEDTFLEDSPIISVSSIDKTGINELVSIIDDMTEIVEQRDVNETPRLPVDRVFTMTGFGTIVTGTLIEGTVSVGDEVEIYPKGLTSKIRSIQVHGQSNTTAYAGQRVAVNLAGLKKKQIDRGNVISTVGAMKSTMMLDVKITLLKHSTRIIENRTRVRLYIGSSEVMCRVVLIDRETLTPGESCFAQLRLEEEISAKRKDKFIIRFYSPMTTIGGGVVLEANPPKRKRFDDSVIKELHLKEKGDDDEVIEKIIKEKSTEFPSIKKIATLTAIKEDKINSIISKLESNGKILTFRLINDIHVIHVDYYIYLKEAITNYLNTYHEENPLKMGILKEELRSKFLRNIKSNVFDKFISNITSEKLIKLTNDKLSLLNFEVKYSDKQKEIKEEISKYYLENEFSPDKRDQIIDSLRFNKNETNKVFDAMIDGEELIKIKEDIYIHRAAYNKALNKLFEYSSKNETIALSDFRDILNTSRKYAMYLLEYFDEKKITKRKGDFRIIVASNNKIL